MSKNNLDQMPALPLILASASPRRLNLLRQIYIEPDQISAAELDEPPQKGELPSQLAKRLAGQKARAVAVQNPHAFILAADTVVACGRLILPKAEDKDMAIYCLQKLSGRAHRVYSAVYAFAPADDRGGHSDAPRRYGIKLVMTRVQFRRLDASYMRDYIRSGEWQGKAGGYAIQGLAGGFVKALNGSYSGVVGLPLYETANLLSGLGYRRFTHTSDRKV